VEVGGLFLAESHDFYVFGGFFGDFSAGVDFVVVGVDVEF